MTPRAILVTMARLVASAHPHLRNTVTREARLFPTPRRFLPAATFESGVRSNFRIDKIDA